MVGASKKVRCCIRVPCRSTPNFILNPKIWAIMTYHPIIWSNWTQVVSVCLHHEITIFHRRFFGNTRILITNGQRTHRTLILLITMTGELYLNATRHFNPSQIPSTTSWRMSCKQYVMICHRTPSTKPHWALSKDFELVWKLGADTLNMSWNQGPICGGMEGWTPQKIFGPSQSTSIWAPGGRF